MGFPVAFPSRFARRSPANRSTLDLKRSAVKPSKLPRARIQGVACALNIYPCMLPGLRNKARETRLPDRGGANGL